MTHPGEKRLLSICKKECRILPKNFEKNLNLLFEHMFKDKDVFKKIFKGRKLVLYSNPMACDFYLKNGFTQEDVVSAKFTYNA